MLGAQEPAAGAAKAAVADAPEKPDFSGATALTFDDADGNGASADASGLNADAIQAALDAAAAADPTVTGGNITIELNQTVSNGYEYRFLDGVYVFNACRRYLKWFCKKILKILWGIYMAGRGLTDRRFFQNRTSSRISTVQSIPSALASTATARSYPILWKRMLRFWRQRRGRLIWRIRRLRMRTRRFRATGWWGSDTIGPCCPACIVEQPGGSIRIVWYLGRRIVPRHPVADAVSRC